MRHSNKNSEKPPSVENLGALYKRTNDTIINQLSEVPWTLGGLHYKITTTPSAKIIEISGQKELVFVLQGNRYYLGQKKTPSKLNYGWR